MKHFASFLILALVAIGAQAQEFKDPNLRAYSCGGRISCGSIQVTERDTRTAPAITQPKADAPTIGACGTPLPDGQDYQARLTGTTCSPSNEKSHQRLPMPVDQDKKDKAMQVLSSVNDSVTKRTRAQELLYTPIKWSDEFQISMSESWQYSVLTGDFNGPSESYDTTCSMDRTETYDVAVPIYETYCAQREIIEDDPPPRKEPTYNPPVTRPDSRSESRQTPTPMTRPDNQPSRPAPRPQEQRPAPPSQPRPKPPEPSPDRLKGTSSSEIKSQSQDNYNKKRRPNGIDGASYKHDLFRQLRSIASREGRCIREAQRDTGRTRLEPRSRTLPSISGLCTARRGTWRTYFVSRQSQRSCAPQTVKVNVDYKLDPNWNPKNSAYLDILPNKYDLLPGESEIIKVKGNVAQNAVAPVLSVENGWNKYFTKIIPERLSCDINKKEFTIEVHTESRIKRRAPNPFQLPEGTEALVGLDDKGRPNALKLVDSVRGIRLDASMNSRQFGQPAAEEKSEPKNIGQSEAGGSEAFWVGTQFRMSLYSYDWQGRKVHVTLPNAFTTNKTDVFRNEMEISLGGFGGMDRLYRPAGPLQFIFGGLYKYLGVELSPNTDYTLEVQAAQREFPFYESTCQNGRTTCGDQEAAEAKFSEPITIKFKTGKTERSLMKWLLDHQFVIW